MAFFVAAEAYDRFMGRYSRLLAPELADLAGIRAGQRALDVGCGPGALIEELVARLGSTSVAAVDPSAPFVAAARSRHSGIEVLEASAEALPFDDAAFDAALAQLVVHFMADPVAGLTEMRRVTRSGGVVAACVWDLGGGHAPHSVFWQAARELDPGVEDEGELAGANQGDLVRLLAEAGLRDINETVLTVRLEHPTFEEWWEPYTAGVGPPGAYLASVDVRQCEALRDRCRALLPEPPFTVVSRAWAARGIV